MSISVNGDSIEMEAPGSVVQDIPSLGDLLHLDELLRALYQLVVGLDIQVVRLLYKRLAMFPQAA